MRALMMVAPGELEVVERPDPVPSVGEVLIRIEATGICGSDVHGFTGATGRRVPGQIMGHEAAGVVVGLGSGIGDEECLAGRPVTFNPILHCGSCQWCLQGQEQACTGRRVIGVEPSVQAAFAEFITVPVGNVVSLPAGVKTELGALVEPLAVGWHALVRGGFQEDQTVAIIGGGPIGQACFLAARRAGADAIAVSEVSKARRDKLAMLGALTIDPRGANAIGALQEALGGPAQLVLDAVGNAQTLADAVSVSEQGAKVVLVGMNERSVVLAAYDWSVAERTLIGSFCYSEDEFRATAGWLSDNSDVVSRLIDDRVSFEQAGQVFNDLASGTLQASKILVVPALSGGN